MIANCPTPEQLESLTLGQLSEEQSDALFFHLESCDSCQTELAQIDSSADSLIVQLKSSASDTEDSLVDGEGCRVAMTRALAALAMVPENAAPGDASIPKTIGDYEIVRPLGHGGMGHVYLGKHTKLNRMVAIKFIADRRRWDQTTRERFESEMRLIGGLKHSHIVSAYDAREVDGLAVLVTEFIDGMTLSEILKRTGTIDVANASQVVGDVCEALQYIQTQGLVHRDIKPSNIMIDTEGNVKLLDLGLARIEQGSEAATEFTATGQAMGTADYIPPEQINDGRNVDIRADIYGLGCTFYKLLTGKAPFAEHSTVFAKMNAHVTETPVSLKTDPRVPAKVAKLVDSMLAKKPEDRPQQPTDAARELETHCTGSDLQDLVVKAQSLPLKTSHEFETTPEQPQTQSGFSSKIPWAAMAAAIAAGLFGFLLGITVAVKKPDGTTAKVEIPAGSTAVVDAEGNIEIRLADSEETARIGKSNVDVQFQMKRGDFRATRHPSVASAQKKYEYAQDALSKSQATQSKPVGQTPTISAKMNSRQDDGGVGLLNTMTFSGTGDHPFFANFSYRIAESSELYKKVERNDKIDIFRVDENSKDEFALHENLIAANVRVYQTKADNQISFSLEDSRKLRALEKSDPKLKNIRFRFHRHESQLLFDRARLNGVWRSVIMKINGEVVGDSKMVTLFHKNELLMCSYGVPNVVEIQVEEGVIECVEDTKKTGDEMKPNATFRYKFLESGRLELLEPRQKMLIRLEKIEAPESKDEKMVFDLLAKATENPDYFQAFIVEPAKASAPESLKVPETEEIVKLVGTPIIDRNHILSVQRTYDERKRFSLAMKLTPEGAARMEHATRNHLRQKMALMIDGQVKIAAIINAVITTGNISLSGDFNKEELDEIVAALVRKLEVPKNQQPGVAKSTPKTASPKPAPLTPSQKKIKKLVEAMQRYELKHHAFPMSQFHDGNHPYSWRVALLPYLGHQDLFDQYKLREPWDSAANTKVLNQMPDVFRHPSSASGSTTTAYLGITGRHGALGYMKQPKGLADYTDGSSNSICIIEIESGLPWTKPNDFVIDKFKWESQAQFEKKFLKIPFFDQNFISVGCADGSTYLLDKETLHADVKRATDEAPGWLNLFTVDDGNPVNIFDYQYLQDPKTPANQGSQDKRPADIPEVSSQNN